MKRKNILGCDQSVRRFGASLLLAFFVGVGVVASADVASARPQRFPGGSQGRPGDGPQGRPGRFDGRNARLGAGADAAQDGVAAPNAANGENGGDGKSDGRGSGKTEAAIPLEQALASGAPDAPILLNQNEFSTQDGVRLVGNFYRGRGDAETVPVILLHDREGNKEQFDALAKQLAASGRAVLVPDLRGCGGSVNRAVRDYSRGNVPTRRQDAQYLMKNFNNDDLRAMIEYDRAVWFNFLLYLHQKEMIDVKKTTIVGAGGLGSAIAAAWTKADWQGKEKTDQNVVGLALLSPDATSGAGKFNSLSALESVRKLAKGKGTFGFVVFVGSMNEEKFNDAKEIQKKIGGKKDEELPPEEKLIPIVAIKTETQGIELLKVESFGVTKTIQQFVATRIQSLPKKRQVREDFNEK